MIPENIVKVEKDSKTTLGGVTKPRFLPNTKKKPSCEPTTTIENATNSSSHITNSSSNSSSTFNRGSSGKNSSSNLSGSHQFESSTHKHHSSLSYRDNHTTYKSNNNDNQRNVSFNSIGKLVGGRGKGRWATPSFSTATFFSGNNLNIQQQQQARQNNARSDFNGPLSSTSMVLEVGSTDDIVHTGDTDNLSNTDQSSKLTKKTKIKVELMKSSSTDASLNQQKIIYDHQHKHQYDPDDDIDSSDSEYEGEDVYGSGGSGSAGGRGEAGYYDASTVSLQMDADGDGDSNQGQDNDHLSAMSSSSSVVGASLSLADTDPVRFASSSTASMSSSSSSSSSSAIDKKSSKIKFDRPPKVWPPLDYHPMLPLSLPIGPEEIITREKISNFPILSGEDGSENEEIRLYEEEKLCFLLQLPSDLKLQNRQNGDGRREDNPIFVNEEDIAATASPAGLSGSSDVDKLSGNNLSHLKPGKIGKLQVMRSGRVYLVIPSNGSSSEVGGADPPGQQSLERRYEVWGGMDVSFAQYISTISIKPTQMLDSNGSSTHVSDSNSKPVIKKEKQVTMTNGKKSSTEPLASSSESSSSSSSTQGDFYILSDITRKLVITPEYLTNNNSHASNITATSGVSVDAAMTSSAVSAIGLRPSMSTTDGTAVASPSKKKIEPGLLKPTLTAPAAVPSFASSSGKAAIVSNPATNFNLIVKQSQKQALLMKKASVSGTTGNKPTTKAPKFNIMSSDGGSGTKGTIGNSKPSLAVAGLNSIQNKSTISAAAETTTGSTTSDPKQQQPSIPIKVEPTNKVDKK